MPNELPKRMYKYALELLEKRKWGQLWSWSADYRYHDEIADRHLNQFVFLTEVSSRVLFLYGLRKWPDAERQLMRWIAEQVQAWHDAGRPIGKLTYREAADCKKLTDDKKRAIYLLWIKMNATTVSLKWDALREAAEAAEEARKGTKADRYNALTDALVICLEDLPRREALLGVLVVREYVARMARITQPPFDVVAFAEKQYGLRLTSRDLTDLYTTYRKRLADWLLPSVRRPLDR